MILLAIILGFLDIAAFLLYLLITWGIRDEPPGQFAIILLIIAVILTAKAFGVEKLKNKAKAFSLWSISFIIPTISFYVVMFFYSIFNIPYPDLNSLFLFALGTQMIIALLVNIARK